jgi:hypothetical protein
MQGKSLAEARRLFRARKFPDVIRFLEPEVFRFRESVDYFLLLGLSCLRTGDTGGAYSYLGRARQLEPKNIHATLGLAAINVKRAETDKALALWLEVLDTEPSNPTAKRGMSLLRKGPSADEIQSLIDTGRVERLFPPLPSRITAGPIVISILVVMIVACLAYLGYRIFQSNATVRQGVSDVDLPTDLPRLIDAGGADSAGYTLSEREVARGFDQAKRYLLAYRDNLAAVQINRILLSNAALLVKERARVLKSFVTRPTFTTFRDGFAYLTVAKDPRLYDGASVRWKGMVANVSVGKDAIRFDFLVGYEQQKQLEGIVPVTLSFAAELDNGMALEILGQVTVTTGKMSLSGISLHRLTLQ